MTLRKEIIAIALPAIAANITTPLLGLIDVAITGHIGAAEYIAAISVGGAMFNMLYWLFNFLRMGTTGFTAQAYGVGKGTDVILWRSLAVALCVGLFMLAFQHVLSFAVINFIDADPTTFELTMKYYNILIWGAPAVMMTYAVSGWFLGMQDSRAQMWTAIAVNVINIIVSLGLVYGLGWKIEGVATGTLLAQWCGLAVALAIVAFKYRPKMVAFRQVLNIKELLSYFRVNTDIFLRTACLIAVTLWFTHVGALAGANTLAANAILLQLFLFFSFFMDGFAFSGEALAGKFAGKSDVAKIKALVRALMRIGLVGAVTFALVYFAFGDLIINLLTNQQEVRYFACRYLPWAAIVPLCGFMAFVWDGIFVGLVKTRSMLLSMAISMIVFGVIWYISQAMQNDGLWLAFNCYLLTRGVVLAIIFRRINRRK